MFILNNILRFHTNYQTKMADTNPKQVIELILEILEITYGSLGYLSFRFHSIKPNSKEEVYVIKYSLVPRSSENKRIFYSARVNIKDKNVFEFHEIKEEELSKE